MPLYQDPRSETCATQFNMKWVERAGLVKFDFLGLKTLRSDQRRDRPHPCGRARLRIAADDSEIYTPAAGAESDINTSARRSKTYALYASARTVAVFQVESSGMMDALRRMRRPASRTSWPSSRSTAPARSENIPTYCDVKNRVKKRASVHPLIDHILRGQGIIVYQEQVMQIAQMMAGYSLGGADLLRQAMGKKNKEAMDAERRSSGRAAKNGVDAKRRRGVRPSREIRQLRLQQVARGGLRGGELPDRLAEGEPRSRFMAWA
ncbi:MAG: hypothetical protein R3D80_20590 [Paracoccaceae bacterium]